MTEFHVEAAYVAPLTDDQLADVAEAVGGVVQYDSESHLLTVATTLDVEDGRAAQYAASLWASGLAEIAPLADAVAVGPVRLTIERADTRAWRMPIVGTYEIAAILRVSPSRVREIAKERPEFPRPVAELAAGKFYRTADVLAFVKGWAREPGRPRAA